MPTTAGQGQEQGRGEGQEQGEEDGLRKLAGAVEGEPRHQHIEHLSYLNPSPTAQLRSHWGGVGLGGVFAGQGQDWLQMTLLRLRCSRC